MDSHPLPTPSASRPLTLTLPPPRVRPVRPDLTRAIDSVWLSQFVNCRHVAQDTLCVVVMNHFHISLKDWLSAASVTRNDAWPHEKYKHQFIATQR